MATNSVPFSAHEQASESPYQKELKIQFFDLAWLSQYSLHSKGMAIEYFYTSPFYSKHRGDTLNELIRAGEDVEDDQDGLLFKVTSDNLDIVLHDAPTAADSRHIYVNENALFHIKLFRRKTGLRGMVSTPIKAYCIVQKKIYRLPSVAEIFNYRMFYATRSVEKCFDAIQAMSQWNLMDGYSWDPATKLDETKELLASCEEFALMDSALLQEEKKTSSDKEEAFSDGEKSDLGFFIGKVIAEGALTASREALKKFEEREKRVLDAFSALTEAVKAKSAKTAQSAET